MDWLDLLVVQQTLKSLLQHHSLKASILWHSAFFTVPLSPAYMNTGKTIAFTRWTFVGKVIFLESYSSIKRNAFESVLMRLMNLEPIIQSEVSQKEKEKYILTHIYGI